MKRFYVMPHLRDSNDWFEKKITLVRKKFTTEKIVAAVRQKYISKKIAPDLDYWLVEHDGYSTNLVTKYTFYISPIYLLKCWQKLIYRWWFSNSIWVHRLWIIAKIMDLEMIVFTQKLGTEKWWFALRFALRYKRKIVIFL